MVSNIKNYIMDFKKAYISILVLIKIKKDIKTTK